MVHHAAAAAGLIIAALVAGCGSSGDSAPLAWQGKPIVVRQPELPDDTIVSGRIRNSSDDPISVDAARSRVVDARGQAVRSTVRFNVGVTHPLYSPRDAPGPEPEFLRRRLGEVATVEPGKTVPLTVSWRVARGSAQPKKVVIGKYSVPLPGAG